MSSKRDIEPDGHTSRKDVEADGFASRKAIEEDDVEGHSMLISPTLERDLAKAKNADVERSVQNKNNQNEAKRVFRR